MGKIQICIEKLAQHITSRGLFRIFDLFSILGISKKKREKHLIQNIQEWGKYQEKYGFDYIEDQQKLGSMRYGNCFASYNACEVIAVWHVLKTMKKLGKLSKDNKNIGNLTFPELLYSFEKKGVILGGGWGTNPKKIVSYFNANHMECVLWTDRELERTRMSKIEQQYDVFILTTYNNRNSIFEMIHTMCVTKDKGEDGKNTFCIHNSGESFKNYSSLYAAVTGYNNRKSGPICLLGIR